MRHSGGQCHCAFYISSEVRILGDVAFTSKPFAHQNGERGTVAACEVYAWGPLDTFVCIVAE